MSGLLLNNKKTRDLVANCCELCFSSGAETDLIATHWTIVIDFDIHHFFKIIAGERGKYKGKEKET